MTSRSDEGSLPHIAFPEMNEVMRGTQVQPGPGEVNTGVSQSGSSEYGS